MQRWLACGFISIYLTGLALGMVSHTLNFATGVHPGTYYFIWDMFCGWTAHELRYHVIAEGESGKFYELTPGPWGGYAPYGDLSRNHYDSLGNTLWPLARNSLQHSTHEPIRRVMMIEEAWSKKYNLADELWAYRHEEEKDPQSYFITRYVFSPEGDLISQGPDFINHLHQQSVVSNPRLMADLQRTRTLYSVPTRRSRGEVGELTRMILSPAEDQKRLIVTDRDDGGDALPESDSLAP